MLTLTVLLTTFAHAETGIAVLEGTDCDATGYCQPYVLELELDGSFGDTYRRSGTYTMTANALGVRTVALDMGSLGITQLQEDPSGCWAEVTPPVNPALGELSLCVQPKLHHLQHFENTCDDIEAGPVFVYRALAIEDGHWNAGRLTPSSPGGFWVEKVSYVMYDNPAFNNWGCTDLDHKVQVFVGADDQPPPATPVVQYEKDMSAAAYTAEFNELTVFLPNAIFVGPGESLWVSVEMLNDGVDATCIGSCFSNAPFVEHNYWSNAVSNPYAWYDLEPFGYDDLMVSADGFAAAP